MTASSTEVVLEGDRRRVVQGVAGAAARLPPGTCARRRPLRELSVSNKVVPRHHTVISYGGDFN